MKSCILHMQPLSVTMSSIEDRQLCNTGPLDDVIASLQRVLAQAIPDLQWLHQELVLHCETSARMRESARAVLQPRRSIIETESRVKTGTRGGAIWKAPCSAACTDDGALVVADRGTRCVYQFASAARQNGAYQLQSIVTDVGGRGVRRRTPLALAVAGQRIFCMLRVGTKNRDGMSPAHLCELDTAANPPAFRATGSVIASTSTWVALAACTVGQRVRIAVIDSEGVRLCCPDDAQAGVQVVPIVDPFKYEAGCGAFDRSGRLVFSSGSNVYLLDCGPQLFKSSVPLSIRLVPAGLLVCGEELVVVDCRQSCVMRFRIDSGADVAFVQAPRPLAGPVFLLPSGAVAVLYACGSIEEVRW